MCGKGWRGLGREEKLNFFDSVKTFVGLTRKNLLHPVQTGYLHCS